MVNNVSSKKKKNWLTKLNQKVKEYQILISVIIGLFSLIAIYISYISLKLSKDQKKLDEITNIQLEPSYSPEGVDLIKVVFHPQSEGVLLKNYEIILLLDFSEEIEKKGFGNSWDTYSFCQGLLTTSIRHLDIGRLEQTIVGPERYFSCYPLAIKFKYLYKGKEKETTNIYKAHFVIFAKGILRVKAFELIYNNVTMSENKLVEKLDQINKKECLGYLPSLENSSRKDLEALSKFYKPLLENLEFSLSSTSRKTFFILDNKAIDSVAVIVPTIAGDTTHNKLFLSNLLFLIENIDSLNLEIRPLIRKVERFILDHPFCEEIDYFCISKSDWSKDEIIKEWRVLNIDLLKEYENHLENLYARYKTKK